MLVDFVWDYRLRNRDGVLLSFIEEIYQGKLAGWKQWNFFYIRKFAKEAPGEVVLLFCNVDGLKKVNDCNLTRVGSSWNFSSHLTRWWSKDHVTYSGTQCLIQSRLFNDFFKAGFHRSILWEFAEASGHCFQYFKVLIISFVHIVPAATKENECDSFVLLGEFTSPIA